MNPPSSSMMLAFLPGRVLTWCLSLLVLFCLQSSALAFTHPGLLHTQADLDRMSAKVAASAQPWKGSWDRLLANPRAQLTWTPQPTIYLIRGSTALGSENYSKAMNDAAAAYQTALRWKITGDTAYADKSVAILNAWAATCTSIEGDSNQSLAAGIYGYQFANAAELMRSYNGWSAADFTNFKNWMVTVFYAKNHDFLIRHHNTCDTHYWSNWDLCNMASMMAIGVLCDDQAMYDEAVDYFHNGVGAGNINRLIHHIHPGFLGQAQESGRDQGHATLSIALAGVVCEQAWNQGLDLYGYDNNRILAAAEYVAKYNLFKDVPFTTYANCEGEVHPVVSATGRGNLRTGWESLYHHYVNRKGLAAPFTGDLAAKLRPEGGGGDHGSTSGGFDHLGFGALVAGLDPIAAGAVPSGLMADPAGGQVTLSWWGSAYATGYNVKRSISTGGPYTTIAVVAGNRSGNYLVDAGLTPGTTCYYVVSANNPGGESANSAEVTAVPNNRLAGAVIGSPGSFGNKGATIATVFDDELQNFYDGVNGSGDWAGLDLGSGVTAVVTQVKYCPRAGFPNRMVGGKFQGSNTADFSSGVVDLFTITTAPAVGVLTSQTIGNGTTFRYLRYLGPNNNYCNVAEVEFHGNPGGLNVPAAPTGLSSVASIGQVDLSWTASAGATSYNLQRSATINGPYVIIGNVTGTTFSDASSLTGGAAYYYVVSALNGAGQSANSTQAVAALPSELTGTIIGTSGSWGNNPATFKEAAMDHNTSTFFDANVGSGAWVGLDLGAGNAAAVIKVRYFPRTGFSARMTGGKFQGSNTADFSSGVVDLFTVAVQPTEGVYTPQSISDGTVFRYVRYLSPTGGSCNVAEVEFHKAGVIPTPPAVPTGLVATAVSSSQINLSWTASAGATSYNVKRATTSGGPYTTLSSPTGTSYADTGLSSGLSYYYVVTAVNTIGESSTSAQASALTIPASPQNVSVTAGNGQATISWNASTGASGYTIERATGAGGPFTIVASGVTGLSHLDTGLSNGTTYYYRVAAGNATGSSATSAVSSSITLPAAPAGLAATAGNTTVSLIWNASTGADSYSVLRSTTSGSGYTAIAGGITATSYNDSGLANGTAYFYVVTATNSSGTGAVSTQASATPMGLPSPWSTLDIGAVAATGTANHNAGTFTLEGSGVDIGGGADEFRYAYQSASGDCDIVVRVTGVEYTSSSAKAGIIVRESTATGSRYAGVFLTPGGQARFQRRTSTNGSTSANTASSITVPRYIRLTRTGSTFNAYHSVNGTTWTQFGGNRSVTMSASVTIGLAVSGFVDGTLCTGTFTNVTVTP